MLAFYLKEVTVMLFYSILVRTNAQTFPNSINLIPVALIMSLGPVFAKVMYERYAGGSRFLGLIPIVAAFFVSPITIINVALLIAPAVYMTIVVARRKKTAEYYLFVELFIFLIIGGLMFLLLYTLMTWQFNQNPSTLIRRSFDDAVGGCKYFVAFFISGVIVARNLRIREKFSFGTIKNFALLAGVVSAVSLMLLGFEKISDVVIKGARWLAVLILLPLGYLSDGWTTFGHKVGEIIETSSGNPLKRESFINYFMEESSGVNVIPLMYKKGKAYLPLEEVYFIVVLILFLIVVIVASMAISRRKHKDNRDEFANEKLKENNTVKKRRLLTKRERVRSLYRRFITIMKARGIVITDNMTSEEVLVLLTELVNYDSAVILRNIYIKARYNDLGDIDASEIKMAREALEKLSI